MLVERVVALTTGQIVTRYGLVLTARDLQVDPFRRVVALHVSRAGVQLARAAASEESLLLVGLQSVVDVLRSSVASGRVQHPRRSHTDEEGLERRGRSVKRSRCSLFWLAIFELRVSHWLVRFRGDVVAGSGEIVNTVSVVAAGVPLVRPLGNGADRFAGTSPPERVYLLAHSATPHSETRA